MENEREEWVVSRGIIYVMTTVVPGLVKIGKTGSSNFEQRMYSLERNGYFNVVGLKRRFAIEVEDYDEKEALLDEIFSKSRVPNSELFALDVDLVIQLLSSLDGRQVYPERESKEDSFDQATEERRVKDDWSRIPDGTYHMEKRAKEGTARATRVATGGDFTVKAGAECLPSKEGVWLPEPRKTAKIVDGVLQEDVTCRAPSTASWVVLGRANNGWKTWKAEDGFFIDKYRKKPEE